MSKKCCGFCKYHDGQNNRCKKHDGDPNYKQIIFAYLDACDDFDWNL